VAQAQSVTPSGFTPSASSKLDVFFNSTMVMTPGQMLSKAGERICYIYNNLLLTSYRNSKSAKDCSSEHNGEHECNLHVRYARSRRPTRGRQHKTPGATSRHEHWF
jgi:hypothetical protein